MVLKVTRLRRRGLTSKCAPLPEPLLDPLPEPLLAPLVPLPCEPSDNPFALPLLLPIFEKQARIAVGGNPVSEDCGYRPRSATSIADGSRSLPTIWIDQSLVPGPADAEPEFSAMPPLRPTVFFSFVSL